MLEEILFKCLKLKSESRGLVQLVRNIRRERDVMLLEIEKVFVTPAGEVCADAAGQRSRQGAEEPQQPESVSGNVLINVP